MSLDKRFVTMTTTEDTSVADDHSLSQEDQKKKQMLFELYRPVLEKLEVSCEHVQKSQSDLREQLDKFLAALRVIKFKSEDDQITNAMEEQSKKLLALKRKLTLVHTIVQSADERAKRLLNTYKNKSD